MGYLFMFIAGGTVGVVTMALAVASKNGDKMIGGERND